MLNNCINLLIEEQLKKGSKKKKDSKKTTTGETSQNMEVALAGDTGTEQVPKKRKNGNYQNW